jgi:hypothetical protein
LKTIPSLKPSEIAEFHGRVTQLVSLTRSAGDIEAAKCWDDLRRRLERRWAEEKAAMATPAG